MSLHNGVFLEQATFIDIRKNRNIGSRLLHIKGTNVGEGTLIIVLLLSIISIETGIVRVSLNLTFKLVQEVDLRVV